MTYSTILRHCHLEKYKKKVKGYKVKDGEIGEEIYETK